MTDKNKMSLLAHLDELRNVILVSLISLIPTTVVGWLLKEQVYNLVLSPLLEINPNFQPIVLKPTDVFFVYMKISLAVGFALASPIIVWQIWKFVVPALKDHEKKILRWVVPSSIILFFIGIVFAYYTVFKVGVLFFYYFDQGTVAPMYGMREYWNFALSFLVPFGVVFELPVVILVLSKLGVITPKWLATNRKYAILIIFISATIITPPDVISQILMAVPMILLYEISIIIAKIFGGANKVESSETLPETSDEHSQNEISEVRSSEEASISELTSNAQVSTSVESASEQIPLSEESLSEQVPGSEESLTEDSVAVEETVQKETPESEAAPEKDYVVSDYEDLDYPVEKKREARLQSILDEIQNANKNEQK